MNKTNFLNKNDENMLQKMSSKSYKEIKNEKREI